MLRNYLIVAVRNLVKNKGLAAINILGLAIGMACVILIGLFIQYEFRYDRHHKNADRIYHVHRAVKMENTTSVSPRTSGALAAALKRDFPEVEQAVRAQVLDGWIKSSSRFFQQQICLADREILEVLTIPFVQGDAETALMQPGSIVLIESMARKYFSDDDPMGEVLRVDHNELQGDFFVTGVVRDFPKNATFRFDCLTATPSGPALRLWDAWQPTGSYRPFMTLVLLREKFHYRELERKLPDFMVRYFPMGEDFVASNRYLLQPLTRAHLYSQVDLGRQFEGYGDIKQIYAFGLVAGFVLLLACINFMNLSTARASARAREVGLRKVVGAFRKQLIVQFLGESILIALVALMLAAALVELALPWFNAFMRKDLILHTGENMVWLVALLLLGLGVGTLAGAYPAFVLSAFNPTYVMKGDSMPGSKRAWLRKGLVVFQFAFSIVFITGTLVVQEQLAYIRGKNLGFDKAHVVGMDIFWLSRQIYHRGPNDLYRRMPMVKRAFLAHPNVLKATVTRFPQGGYITTDTFEAEGSDADWQMGVFDVDSDYLDFFDIELAAGRMPEWTDFRDSREKGIPYLLNETAARQLGWDEPVGKRFRVKNDRFKGYVIGVMKDFHVESLHNEIRPVTFRVATGGAKHLYLKLGPGDLSETLAFLAETWNQFLPEAPFDYHFLDDDLTRVRYENEIRTGKALAVFSGLTIFVACLGLFGLIAFRAVQKTKEIGIRKVMGASVGHIFMLMAREFVQLVGIACLIACPIAYVLANRWLQDFAYRIDVGLGVFALSGSSALLIALMTVSDQALKAARSNPVDSLRTE